MINEYRKQLIISNIIYLKLNKAQIKNPGLWLNSVEWLDKHGQIWAISKECEQYLKLRAFL